MSICTGAVYRLKELNNLFIELTAKNCNQKCESCYIDFPMGKKVKDFISLDCVKNAITDLKDENLYCIYLTGAEPMTHPDFNTILRLCLKRCNVCICTNSTFLNEKKVRFLKKVEDESSNQIFFKLTLTHYNESENDKSRFRGSFRQTFFALKTLERYNFMSVLNIQNYYNLDKDEILNSFKKLFEEHSLKNTEIQITVSYPSNCESGKTSSEKTDCMQSRTLTQSGIYACPFLANDYRGRVGNSLKDYSKTVSAETDFCLACAKNNNTMFCIG